MKLERLTLNNFRNYSKQVFNFGDTTVIVAANGAGKTNILEAVYLLSSGASERAGEIGEMIKFESDIASVAGIVEHQEERTELSVVLTHGVYMGKRTAKRRYLVDSVARTRATFSTKLPSIMFAPQDMRLIEGSPSRRRSFLDSTLAMVHPDYARALSVYEGSLRRRNRILDAIRDGLARREQLTYWDQSIIKNGNILTEYRRDFLAYLTQVKTSFGAYKLEYDASTISPARLEQYAQAEVSVGYTLVGPHKDDFVIKSKGERVSEKSGKDLMKYGSRGEQRLAVLFLKLGVIAYTEDKLGIKPILLLDDIFSELDIDHRKEIVSMMEGRQVIITTAEEESIVLVPGARVIRLGNAKGTNDT